MEKYIISEFEDYGREPIIFKLRDKSLICTFLTGGPTEPHNDNVLKCVRSYDDGKTWTSCEVLIDHPDRGVWGTDISYIDGVPTIALHLYDASTHYRELQTFYSKALDDGGKQWSKPQSFAGSVNNCSLRQCFKLSNGDYFYPLYWTEVIDCFEKDASFKGGNAPFRTGAGISHDGGKTWYRYGYMAADCSLWEPNAVEVENGHIIMYMRANKGYLFISESFDYGRTWSEAKISDIPNPYTKINLIKIRGTIFLINNFNPKFGWDERKNLCIYKSTDGKSFEKVMNIEPEEEWWFYPQAFADDETETLYVAYENAKIHKLAKISYKELGL